MSLGFPLMESSFLDFIFLLLFVLIIVFSLVLLLNILLYQYSYFKLKKEQERWRYFIGPVFAPVWGFLYQVETKYFLFEEEENKGAFLKISFWIPPFFCFPLYAFKDIQFLSFEEKNNLYCFKDTQEEIFYLECSSLKKNCYMLAGDTAKNLAQIGSFSLGGFIHFYLPSNYIFTGKKFSLSPPWETVIARKE